MSAFQQLPSTYDLEFIQGDDFPFSILVQEGSPAVAKDLTGFVFDAHIRTAAADIIIETSCETPLSGVVEFLIAGSQTEDLVGDYGWEFDWIDDDGMARTIITGTAKIRANG